MPDPDRSARGGEGSPAAASSLNGKSALCRATSSSGDAVFFNSCNRCIADAMSIPGVSWTTDSCRARGLMVVGDDLALPLEAPRAVVKIAAGYRSLTPIVSVELTESLDVRRKESRESFLLVSGKDCFSCCFKFFGPLDRVLMSK